MTKTIITLVVFLFTHLFAHAQNCEEDTTLPTVKCRSGLTVMVGEPITPDLLDDGSFDDCTPKDQLILTFCKIGPCVNTTLITYSEPGEYPISLFARDRNGNIASCSTRITVTTNCEEDNIPPSRLMCSDSRAKTNTFITASSRAFALDNCTAKENLRFSFSPDPNDNRRFYEEPGIYLTTIFVTDQSGNQSSCSKKLYVEQNCEAEGYQFVCRDDVYGIVNNPINAATFFADVNCAELRRRNQGIYFSSHDNQSTLFFSEPGIYPLEVTAVTPDGLPISCNTSVQILPPFTGECSNDNIPPVVSCRSDIYINVGESLSAYTLVEKAEDNCPSIKFSYSPNNLSDKSRTYDVPGVYNITVYAHDGSGNVSSCSTRFRVLSENNCEDDRLPPRPLCTRNLTGRPGEPIWTADALNFASDNCLEELDILASFDKDKFVAYLSFEEPGTYPYTIWVTDESGNRASCTEDVEVYNCEDLEVNIEVEMRGENTGVLKASTNLEHNYLLKYCWNDNPKSVSQSIAFNGNGTYKVNVFDHTGCTQSTSINIENGIVYQVESECVDGKGTIKIDPAFGLPPYALTYTLPDNTTNTLEGEASYEFKNLNVGIYSLTITDSEGTSRELEIEMTLSTFLPNGRLSVVANCGKANIYSYFEEEEYFTFLWSNGETSRDIIGIDPGVYMVTITNEYGCESIETIEYKEETDGLEGISIEYDCEAEEVLIVSSLSGYIYDLLLPDGTYIPDAKNLQIFATSPGSEGIYQYTIYSPNGCVGTWEIDISRADFLNICGESIIEEECAIMQIDMAATRLRRCFDNNIYYVEYANYGAETAENAYAEVQLDPFLTYVSSTIPAEDLGENRYRFDLGNVEGGKFGTFQIQVEASCESVLGQTHCSEARIYPNQPCETSSSWSGAEVSVEARCDAENVVLSIENTGTANMDTPLSYITIEDVVMLNQGNFQLNVGERQEFKLPKNGSTYRLQAEQVDNYPLTSRPSIAIEGCGINENGTFSTGFITQFPLDENDRSVAIDCQDNIGSFDPNDKLATPTGVGADHLLPNNTNIEYKIRFQNTGTDTAFKVVILDTLSALLDTASIQLGTSSHPYNYELLNGNVMQFTFDNILLPDSSTNLLASEGFVQFSISQMPNLPDGSLIENSAAIYFDFNAPIITNTFQHLIGLQMQSIISKTNQIALEKRPINISPNPTSSDTRIKVSGKIENDLQIEIYDQLGKLQLIKELKYNETTIEENVLTSGYYFFKIISPKGVIGHGTFLKQ